MSELKAIKSGEIYDIIEYEDCYRTDDLYYPKSEADKVIANKDKEIRRYKHKRCLDVSMWCDTKADWYYSISGFSESFRDRVDFYIKWRDKWKELAQKFKERI